MPRSFGPQPDLGKHHFSGSSSCLGPIVEVVEASLAQRALGGSARIECASAPGLEQVRAAGRFIALAQCLGEAPQAPIVA